MVVYSRAGCPLCDEAITLARRAFGVDNVKVVDIKGDRELEDLYVFRVPVLTYLGEELAEGRVTGDAIQRARRQVRQAEARGIKTT